MAKKGVGCGTVIAVVVVAGFLMWALSSPEWASWKRGRSQAKAQKEAVANRRAAQKRMEAAKWRDKRRADLKTFVAVLKKAGIGTTTIIRCEPHPDVPHKIRIVVADAWHYDPYQIRLQAAQVLWEAWAKIHTPQEPDKSRIVLVDRMGNEVGGSRLWGGSLIWVKE